MYCGGCGQALVAGQAFCPRCGRTNVAGVPAGVVPAIPSLTCVEKRVNALAVGWLVYAGFVVFFGVIGLFFAEAFLGGWAGHGMHGPFSGLANGHAHWHGFFNGLGMPLFFVRLGWLALLIRAGLAIAAGVGLQQKAPWGRWVAIVAAFLALFNIPFGTAMGIWTLVVLLNSSNAAGYEAMAHG
jgi:hypothetical protein